MACNSEDILKIVSVVAVILFFLWVCGCNPIQNEGSLDQSDNSSDKNNDNNSSDYSNDVSNSVYSDDNSSYDIFSQDSESMGVIRERAMGRNNLFARKTDGSNFKPVSYRAGYRENKGTDKAFKVDDVTKNFSDRFVPVDDSNGEGAPINIGKNNKCEEDRYNINSYLPQEKEKDWFETIETVDVKNSHLINIYRPIGVNTIGSSLKNASYDIRGNGGAIAPKFVVAPWLQSSYEPDRSAKTLC
jgi:hypothetical protein